MLRNKGQQLIDYNLRRENYRRRNFDYQQGQWVLELTTNPGKLGPSTKGPYQPSDVASFGTVYMGNGDPSTPDDVSVYEKSR